MRKAEQFIIKLVQKKAFVQEILTLPPKRKEEDEAKNLRSLVKKTSSLYRFDPYIDKDGIVRVGGRIRRANLPREITHPVLLPKQEHITKLVIAHYHEKIGHPGCGMTINEIRSSGYWIIASTAAVSSHIWKCVRCRKLRRPTQLQRMSDLPKDRLEPAPPFTYSAVDYFSPFYVKENERKRKDMACYSPA
ncbi:uncharacterized protein [Ptychodera flava]|uniref:uncharacterized protein n=1 Tax=Ptychodera flava TaxID=63121 RepID=UPI00396A4842